MEDTIYLMILDQKQLQSVKKSLEKNHRMIAKSNRAFVMARDNYLKRDDMENARRLEAEMDKNDENLAIIGGILTHLPAE